MADRLSSQFTLIIYMFWHSVWISAGKPINTDLHRIMKETRNAYHFQIRKNKKLTENLQKNAFLNACISNNGDNFQLIRKERATSLSHLLLMVFRRT